jgi:Uma2 family endonuclease
MSSVPRTLLDETEYLAIERRADFKSEFYRGEMFAMAGASKEHNVILLNVGAELRGALRNRPCQVYPSGMRVKVSKSGLYFYPDVTVACGDIRFEDDHVDTLLNPVVIHRGLIRIDRSIRPWNEVRTVSQDKNASRVSAGRSRSSAY